MSLFHHPPRHVEPLNPELDQRLRNIEQLLKQVLAKENIIIMDEQKVKDALSKIDAATTKIGANIQTVADTDQKISDEIDALQSALAAALANGTGVTQDLVDQAAAVSAKAQASSDALDALVPVLEGIAAKGVVNLVPVPVPTT